MLVLSRKKNEAIVINDVIKVTVIEVRGDKVRLGLEAPRDIEVHRQEVYEQIHGKRLEGTKMQLRQLADGLTDHPLAEADIYRICVKALDSMSLPDQSP